MPVNFADRKRRKRTLDEGEADKVVPQLAQLADELDVPIAGLEEAHAGMQRSRDVRRLAHATREDDKFASNRIARQLVAGELTLEQAAAEALTVTALRGDSILSAAIAHTPLAAERMAVVGIVDGLDGKAGEALLKRCRTIGDTAIDGIRNLRPALAGARSANAAAKVGPDAAVAWVEYERLRRRFNAAHELVELLRSVHWLEPLPNLDVDPMVGRPTKCLRPDLLQLSRKAADMAREPWAIHLDETTDESEPVGPLTTDEYRDAVSALNDLDPAVEAERTEQRMRAAVERRRRPRTGVVA